MTKIRVSRIDYLNAEQVIDPAPKNRGIRMNVYAKERGMDEHVCDLEMQAQPEIRLGKRLRYYQSALDARELPAGEDYGYPPESFIIFLCSQDPFGYDVPVYRFERCCLEVPELSLGNESHWIALNARAWETAENDGLRDVLRCTQTGEGLGL